MSTPPLLPRISTLARSQAMRRTWPIVLDLFVGGIGLACFYGIVKLASYWLSAPTSAVVISLSPRALPVYALASIARIAIAYLISLIFAIAYGYIAAYSRRLETFMLASLDILQSIPVLSFLPGVMLAVVALFPAHQFGIEFGAVLLIFTGQVWNIAFSFYSSLKSMPKELKEVATVYGFSRWQRLWQLELPFSAIGLIWNSMVSVAGGWFFLMACEMFQLGPRDFRLPGLGSYLQTAADKGDGTAMMWGLATMVGIIVLTDFIVWRPVIAWGERFRMDNGAAAARPRSPILFALQQSTALRALASHTVAPMQEKIYARLAAKRSTHQVYDSATRKTPSRIVRGIIFAAILGIILYGAFRALQILQATQLSELGHILLAALATFFRVLGALALASLWTIPVGILIGLHPRLSRIAQPLAQIAASIPATALFPLILVALLTLGAGMNTAAVILMLLGAQWYILFNVIAGATAIPRDLMQVSQIFRFSAVQRWKTILLPAVFPYLITGLVTASGAAWNLSIIAEYFHLKGRTLTAFGLGAQISAATDHGEFHLLLIATIVMALMVVTINRLVWRPLFRIAETKYRLSS